MMAQLFVTYAADAGSRFDRDYYVATHMPLVEREWGPTGLVTAQAFFPAGEGAAHVAVAVLTFRDEAAIAASLASAATPTVLGDVPNFTDIAPSVQKGVAP
jgi:uncharacterized protein (TIGR02118 family)